MGDDWDNLSDDEKREMLVRDNWESMSDDEKRLALVGEQTNPVYDAFTDAGVTLAKVARVVKGALNARKVVHIKLKGSLPVGYKPRPGYRVVIASERMAAIDPESGAEIIIDPGESVLEYAGVDHGMRLKAAETFMRATGLNAPDRQEITKRETVVHVHTHMPRPDPLPPGFAEGAIEGEVEE